MRTIGEFQEVPKGPKWDDVSGKVGRGVLSCGAFAGQASTALGVFVQSVHPSLTLTAENVKSGVSWDLTSGWSGEGGISVLVGARGGATM